MNILSFSRLKLLDNKPVLVFSSDTDKQTYGVTLEDLGVNISPFVTGVSVDWGEVGGTLSDQTDLQAALNSKIELNNVYVIKSAQDLIDLPSVVTDATTIDITALGTCTLLYNGFINYSPRKIVFTGDTNQTVVVLGMNQRNDIGYTDRTDTLYEFTDCDLIFRFCTHSAPFATKGVVDVKNSAGREKSNSFQIINSFINSSIGGTFTDLSTVSTEDPSFVGDAATGYIFRGGFGRVSIRDNQFVNISGIALDILDATFDSFTIADSVYETGAGRTFIKGNLLSANINAGGQGTISGVTFEGAESPVLDDITSSDERWDVNTSPPLATSTEAAIFNITPDVATASSGTFIPLVYIGTAFSNNARINKIADNDYEFDGVSGTPLDLTAVVGISKDVNNTDVSITWDVRDVDTWVWDQIDATAIGFAEVTNKAVTATVLSGYFAKKGDRFRVSGKAAASYIVENGQVKMLRA